MNSAESCAWFHAANALDVTEVKTKGDLVGFPAKRWAEQWWFQVGCGKPQAINPPLTRAN